MVEVLYPSHVLSDLGGETWQQKFNIAEQERDKIILCEIQLGLKYGQDAAKTHVPDMLLKTRIVEYERALRDLLGPTFVVPYAKGFKKKLKEAYQQDTEMNHLMLKSYSTYQQRYQRGYNLVASTQMRTLGTYIKPLIDS